MATLTAEAVHTSSAQCHDERRKLTLNLSNIDSDKPLQPSQTEGGCVRCVVMTLFPLPIQFQPPCWLQMNPFEDICIRWEYLQTNPLLCTSPRGPFPFLDEVVGLLPPSQASGKEGRTFPVAFPFSRPPSRTNWKLKNDQASRSN